MYGLTLLQDAIKNGDGKQRRPLNRVITPEEIEAFSCRSMRDQKNEERMKMTKLRTPDEV